MSDAKPTVCIDTDQCTVPNAPFEERCPKCGDPVVNGFGLAFGGFGAYQYCSFEGCDWATKHYEPEDGE